MKTAYLASACLALGLLAAAPSEAGVLYTNGAINGTNKGWNISNGFTVADSFTLTGNSVLQSITNVGLWQYQGDAATSLSWYITNTNGNILAMGTSNISETNIGNSQGYVIWNASFALPNVGLGAGTYYLDLYNAQATNGDNVFWDENDGPSNAVQCSDFFGCYGVGSQSFTINGVPSVPEPATLSLIGAGLIGAAAFRRKKRA